MKYTPGPWYLIATETSDSTAIATTPQQESNGTFRVENGIFYNDNAFYHLSNGTEVLGSSEWLRAKPADLQLMAAAPELLEAAKLALSVAESWIHSELDGTTLLDKALTDLEPVRAAIKKATGGK